MSMASGRVNISGIKEL